MRTNVIIVENFYSDPLSIRSYALTQSYVFPYQCKDDVLSGRSPPLWLASTFREPKECPFKSSNALIQRLEQITGDRIDREHWNLPFPIDADGRASANCTAVAHSCLWNCCFHLKPKTQQSLGEGVHNHVTDIWNNVGRNGWAGIIYLSENAPLGGGLKLWRNRNPAHDLDWMTPATNWELIDDLGNVCNRLLLARGNIPHSGAAGWGAGLKDGRLYQTFFFRVHDHPQVPSLELKL